MRGRRSSAALTVAALLVAGLVVSALSFVVGFVLRGSLGAANEIERRAPAHQPPHANPCSAVDDNMAAPPVLNTSWPPRLPRQARVEPLDMTSLLKGCANKPAVDFEPLMDSIVLHKRRPRMEVAEFVCEMQCAATEPELERSVRDMRMAEHHWKQVADYCVKHVAPMLFWFTESRLRFLDCRQTKSVVPWMMLFNDLVRLVFMTTQIVRLPASDFLLAFDPEDWAAPSNRFNTLQYLIPLPGLARFVGTDAHAGVLLPTNAFILQSSLCSFNSRRQWWRRCRQYDDDQGAWPWERRSDVVFWRGLPTGAPFSPRDWRHLPRSKLVREFRHAPGFDVAFVRGLKQVANWSKELHAEMTAEWFQKPLVDIGAHVQHKFLLHLDGNTASWGLAHKLNSGSAVFLGALPACPFF